jgi:hypothetical protein
MRVLQSVLMVVLAAAVADAQQASPRTLPKVADTVRIWAESPSVDGRLGVVRRLGDDTVIVALRTSGRNPAFLDTPLSPVAIRRIDLLTGRGPDRGRAFGSTVGGALLGGLIGGTIGNMTEPEICDAGCEALGGTRSEFRGGKTLISALAGAGIGAVIGAYLGSQPVARWSRIW